MDYDNTVPKCAKHDDENVKGFFGPKYRFLSNFWICPNGVEYDRVIYQSVENAYHASKVIESDREKLQTCSPTDSKKIWKKCKRIDDSLDRWDGRKYDVMASLIFDKFHRNPTLNALLLETGMKYLEETNFWGDSYWGVDTKKGGQNKLGIILMATRSHLRTLGKHK